MSGIRQKLIELRKKTLKPSPKMNLVEWADIYRYLSSESSSEPGKFKTSRVEAARGPMLAVTEKGVHKLTVVSSTQLMKTELLNNIVAYFVHEDPCPMILMQPTESMAGTWSTDRLDPMIRDNPCLRDLFVDKKSRDSGNTKDYKKFPGGYIAMIGANSPAELASRPVRIVLCDEVDKYPASAGKEGDPISLISERSATFWNHLIVHVCSPTIEGMSRIMSEYELSDKRVPFVDCPHCKESLQITGDKFFELVNWEEGHPEEAMIYCPHCGEGWTEIDRQKAIKRIDWVATAPFNGHAGFKASKLISPWETVAQLAKKWEDAKGSPEKEKTFTNTQLAETYKERGEVPEWERIYERRELYTIGSVPKDVLLLTMGVDVQKDRLEAEVVGWCRDRRSYSIDYRVLRGDTDSDAVWVELEKLIHSTFTHENGFEMPIRQTAIDSGYRTNKVYSFVRKFSENQVIAIKGSDSMDVPIKQPKPVDVRVDGKLVRRGIKLWPCGSSVIKTEFYGFLKKFKGSSDEYPTGYCHFPMYDEEFFKMLTAEQLLVKIDPKGYQKYEWVKIRERNEALDTRVYATFASLKVGITRFKDKNWDKLEEELGACRPVKKQQQAEKSPERHHENREERRARLKERRRDSSIW